MGMRQNIELKYDSGEKIYIYSHWGGESQYKDSDLACNLKKALERNQRWDDESYLARIIFSEVVRDHLDSETGFGLQPYEIDPDYPTIKVDLHNQTVDGHKYQDFIDNFYTL